MYPESDVLTKAQEELQEVYAKIEPYVQRTPIIQSNKLNELLGHDIYFKLECRQTTGSFKVRGIVNKLLNLKKQRMFPRKVTAVNKGNHAVALAWAARQFDIPCIIFSPTFMMPIKDAMMKSYGAKVIDSGSYEKAERQMKAAKNYDFVNIQQYGDKDILDGHATVCYEALAQLGFKPNAIFTPCGGGGFTAATVKAKDAIARDIKCFAARADRTNRALKLQNESDSDYDGPQSYSIAEEARTLRLQEKEDYFRRVDAFLEVDEDQIVYWTYWLKNLLGFPVEPTAALAMAGAHDWLKKQGRRQKILIFITGGNFSEEMCRQVDEISIESSRPSLLS